MSQLNRWLKRTKQRATPYKLITLTVTGFGLWVMVSLIIPSLFSAWSQLVTRTPLGQSRLIPIAVSTDHLSAKDQELLKAHPKAVEAHQIKPSLKLLGIGQRLVGSGGESQFTIGLLPSIADQVLKSETRVNLKVSAPSFELLTQELIYSKRGERLREEISQAQQRFLNSWSQMWPEIKSQLQAQLQNQALFSKLMNDQVFIDHVKQAFFVEVSSRINLNELTNTLGQSKAVEDLGSLALKHVGFTSIFKETIGGAVTGVKRSGKAVGNTIDQEVKRGTIIPDLSYCVIKASSLFMPKSLYGALGYLFDVSDSQVCEAVVKGSKSVIASSAKRGGLDLAKQSLNSLLREREATGIAVGDVASIVNQQIKPKVLLKSFWMALSEDQELIEHLQSTYGSEGLARVTGALRAISSSPVFTKRLNELSAEAKHIAQRGLSALLLDQAGKGPNPLLLAVIQEQLSGQQRPIIHIVPGGGDKLSPGHVFQHQGEVY